MPQTAATVLEIELSCKKCGMLKPVSEFQKEPRNKLGISGTCRTCDRERKKRWARENPDSVTASRNAWAKRNPEKVAANRASELANKLAKTKERRGETWGPRETPQGRRCSGCQERKQRSEFGKCKTAHDGLQPFCKPCANVRSIQAQRALSPEIRYHRGRKSSLKKHYGLTIEAYEALLSAQGHACAICREPIKDAGRSEGLRGRNASVDHDHETGAIRGVLCVKCNSGLGQFRDSEYFLESAVLYLRRARGTD